MKRSITQRLFLGIKKGFLTPTLPENILRLNSMVRIRILRVLGGISFIILLSNSYIQSPIIILYLAMFISIIFTLYNFYITYYRIKHIYKVLKSDELDI